MENREFCLAMKIISNVEREAEGILRARLWFGFELLYSLTITTSFYFFLFVHIRLHVVALTKENICACFSRKAVVSIAFQLFYS